ncbi:homeodomain-interacting protein kinase 2-like [Lates japonicus]
MKKWKLWKNIFDDKLPSSAEPSSEATSGFADDENKQENSEVTKSDILCSSTSRYLIQDLIGEGSFGKVAMGVNLITSQDVALKILKTEDTAEREIKMLYVVSILDPVKKNIVQFYEMFEHKGQTCLVFEMLDRSLFQLFKEREGTPLSLNEIRPITHQLLTAFDALKGIGVVHSDLKPDNIMLVNHPSEPFRVKVIDFGVSFKTSENTRGMTIQPLGYRAPEVILGLPITETIDMWGLGCVLGFLYRGRHLFADCEYQSMKGIVDILGQPTDHLLSAGYYTRKFFTENKHWDNPRWWMKTPVEYQMDTGIEPKRWQSPFRRLEDLIIHYPEMEETKLEDQRAFVSLLKCLLHTHPKERITPEKALTHPFVEMDHLEHEIDTSLYVEDSIEKMMVLPVNHSVNSEAEEQSKGGEASSKLPSDNNVGSDTPRSCVSLISVKIILDSTDGAEAAVAIDATVSQGAASQAEETDGVSADQGPPAKVFTDCLHPAPLDFGRALRALFGMKKRE